MPIPKPLTLHIIYEGRVAHVTGKASEYVIVSEGLVFIDILQQIFISYPEIEKKFPPGSLGLLINGRPPIMQDMPHEGDEIALCSVGFVPSVS